MYEKRKPKKIQETLIRDAKGSNTLNERYDITSTDFIENKNCNNSSQQNVYKYGFLFFVLSAGDGFLYTFGNVTILNHILYDNPFCCLLSGIHLASM